MGFAVKVLVAVHYSVLAARNGYTRKCSGIKGSMSKVAKSFICRGCLNLVTSAGHTSVDIGDSAKLELVNKFCYLGDMLSVDGDADAAVETRIRIGRNKFRQLVPMFTSKDVSLIIIILYYANRQQHSNIQ